VERRDVQLRFNRLAISRNPFCFFPSHHQQEAQVVECFAMIGLDPDRLAEVLEGFIVFPLFDLGGAQGVFGQRIFGGRLDGVGEQGFGVFPEPCLNCRQGCASRQQRGR
jgi:hypothetical protein